MFSTFRIFAEVKKTSAIFLSALLLLSSMGFTVSTHFCGDHASERVISVEKKDLDCGMKVEKAVCDLQVIDTEIQASPCCSNEYASYILEDEYQAGSSIQKVEKTFLIAWVMTHFMPDAHPGDFVSNVVPYTSPPLIQDVPVLNQSFLL